MGTDAMHPGFSALVALGWITQAQAEAADAYADELTEKVFRGEMKLEEAAALMDRRAWDDAVANGVDLSRWMEKPNVQ